MIIFLIRTASYLGTAALGLLVTSWVLAGFNLQWGGFLITVLVFAVTNLVLTPFIFRMANRYAPMASGRICLLSARAALLVANFFSGGPPALSKHRLTQN